MNMVGKTERVRMVQTREDGLVFEKSIALVIRHPAIRVEFWGLLTV